MPSDAISATEMLRRRLALSVDTPAVSLTHCDGRYRAYQHGGNGLWYLCAFTRQSDHVARSIYGPTFNGQRFPCYYREEIDAEVAVARLNLAGAML